MVAASATRILIRLLWKKSKNRDIEVEIVEVNKPHAQRVAVEAIEHGSHVKTLNYAGARLILLDASSQPRRSNGMGAEAEYCCDWPINKAIYAVSGQ